MKDLITGNNTTNDKADNKSQPVTRNVIINCEAQVLYFTLRALIINVLMTEQNVFTRQKHPKTSVQGIIKYRSGERFREPQQ